MRNAQRLKGKVAMVTGASQGLGQYLAEALAAEGAAVVLVARSEQRLDAVRRNIERAGGTALALPTNVADPAACDAMMRQALERFGALDILVLNAALATYGTLDELETFSPIRDAMEVNFFGAAYPTYLAIKPLMSRKGIIAYVTSGAGHLPMAGYLGYTTSKHAMNGFFEALRLEMFPHGVDVLTVNPGDMYNDDGAGRAVFGPDGSEHKVDLSIKRENDIPRVPASAVATKVLEAIVARKRNIDLSPSIQKFGTVMRTIVPGTVDRRIAGKAKKMRSAFATLEAELRAQAGSTDRGAAQ